jgi:hypothetical protein
MWWARVMTIGYALWFVALLGMLGFFAGWQVDLSAPPPATAGRLLFTLAGCVAGAAIAWRVVLRHRRRA